jgi:hypothetical protein
MLIQRIGLEIAAAAQQSDGKGGGDNRLQAVYFDDDGRVLASDGHLLVRMRALTKEPDLFLTERLAMLEPMRAISGILPADVVLDFNRACKKAGCEQIVLSTDDDGKVTLCTVDGKATRTFLVEQKEIAQPLNFEKLLEPAIGQKQQITFSVELLQKLLKVLAACGAGSVRLAITAATDPVHFRARSIDGEVEGVVMPMHDPDADEQTTKLPQLPAAATPSANNAQGNLLDGKEDGQ